MPRTIGLARAQVQVGLKVAAHNLQYRACLNVGPAPALGGEVAGFGAAVPSDGGSEWLIQALEIRARRKSERGGHLTGIVRSALTSLLQKIMRKKRGRLAASPFPFLVSSVSWCLDGLEVHRHLHAGGDGLAVAHGRLEAPLAHAAARSRSRSPLRSTTRTSTGLPWVSTSATTTTVPPTGRAQHRGRILRLRVAGHRPGCLRLMGAGRLRRRAQRGCVHWLLPRARSRAGSHRPSPVRAGRPPAWGGAIASTRSAPPPSPQTPAASATRGERRGSTVALARYPPCGTRCSWASTLLFPCGFRVERCRVFARRCLRCVIQQ